MNHLLLKRSRIALNEVYDVVCEGRTPTGGHEATIDAAMEAFAKSWRRE